MGSSDESSSGPAGGDPAEVLRSALATMTHADRAAIALHYLNGMTFDEVAAALRTTPLGVRTRTDRALKKLRMWLSGYGIDLATPAMPRELNGRRLGTTAVGERLRGVAPFRVGMGVD